MFDDLEILAAYIPNSRSCFTDEQFDDLMRYDLYDDLIEGIQERGMIQVDDVDIKSSVKDYSLVGYTSFTTVPLGVLPKMIRVRKYPVLSIILQIVTKSGSLNEIEQVVGLYADKYSRDSILYLSYEDDTLLEGTVKLYALFYGKEKYFMKNDVDLDKEINSNVGSFDYLLHKENVTIPKKDIVVSARPAMGKTTYMLTVGNNLAKLGKKVLYFSFGTPKEYLIKGFENSKIGVSDNLIIIPGYYSYKDIANMILLNEDYSYPDFIFIDDNKIEEDRSIFHNIARAYATRFIYSRMLSRDIESRDSKVPLISDAILDYNIYNVLLYREAYYNIWNGSVKTNSHLFNNKLVYKVDDPTEVIIDDLYYEEAGIEEKIDILRFKCLNGK